MTDLSRILKKYKKGWIALSPNNENFVAQGKTLKEVLKKAQKKGVNQPSVLKASPIDNYFIG